MLSVSIDLRQEVVGVLARVHEARLHRSSAADVERQLYHSRPRAPAAWASGPVSSLEPSSISRASNRGAWRRSRSTTSAIVADSLYAGMTARYKECGLTRRGLPRLRGARWS